MSKSTSHGFPGIIIFCRRNAALSANVAKASERKAERQLAMAGD
jgi:cob(I)alamin adenosyltransferase